MVERQPQASRERIWCTPPSLPLRLCRPPGSGLGLLIPLRVLRICPSWHAGFTRRVVGVLFFPDAEAQWALASSPTSSFPFPSEPQRSSAFSPPEPRPTMTISRLTQLVLAAPGLVAAVIMSLSGLPGRQGLGDALRANCALTAHPTGFSPPHIFAPKGVRIDWGPLLTAPERLSCQLVTLFEAAAWVSSSLCPS